MREALGAVMELAFMTLDLHRLELRIMEGNVASERAGGSLRLPI